MRQPFASLKGRLAAAFAQRACPQHSHRATSVTFKGTPTAFTVVTGSLIKTTVPAGATTGTVQVVTPSGTLSSNVPFRVAP